MRVNDKGLKACNVVQVHGYRQENALLKDGVFCKSSLTRLEKEDEKKAKVLNERKRNCLGLVETDSVKSRKLLRAYGGCLGSQRRRRTW